jgi:hypothetical protein
MAEPHTGMHTSAEVYKPNREQLAPAAGNGWPVQQALAVHAAMTEGYADAPHAHVMVFVQRSQA